MKVSIILIITLMMTGVKVIAQEATQTTKVRVKKTEIVNGTNRTTDTTYTIQGPIALDAVPGIPNMEEHDLPANQKIVIVTDEIHGENLKEVKISEEMDDQMRRALEAAGVDGKVLDVDAVMIIDNKDEKPGDKKAVRKIVIVKTIKLGTPDKSENEMLEKTTGINDGKLDMKEMKFYPNPNNGKFNLNFDLKERGDTKVQVLNSEGKEVYNEKLVDFTGTYDKELDISKFPKGVYFVRVEQNSHAQVKKIVLE